MSSQLGDKLAASVREAKQQQTSTPKPAEQTNKPAEPEAPLPPMPAKRVWPD